MSSKALHIGNIRYKTYHEERLLDRGLKAYDNNYDKSCNKIMNITLFNTDDNTSYNVNIM